MELTITIPLKPKYMGMSYEQASREAARLLGKDIPNWCWYLDDLLQLRQIMQRENQSLK